MMESVVALLHSAQTIAVVPHVSPDGDAMGSALALARALRTLGKQAIVVAGDPLPPDYAFLPDAGHWLSLPQQLPPQDVCIMVDVCGDHRIGSAQAVWTQAHARACIDHHKATPEENVASFIDASSASCAQLVLKVVDALGVSLDTDLATLIFTGISTDTGHFMHANTGPDVFADAARLTAAGARVTEIARRIYQERSLAKTRLLGAYLASLQMHANLRIACATLLRADYDACGAIDSDTEGLVNYGLAIRGVAVSVLAREVSPGSIRFNLRSLGPDVAAICRQFGGGGHTRAAGCTLEGDIETTRLTVLNAITQAIVEDAP